LKLWIAVLSVWSTVGLAAEAPSEVPFRLVDGWAIIVDGTLGGLPHQKMLIDTGAVPSAVNARVAKQLGLSGSPAELSVMNRSVGAERVRVPDVRLGPLSVHLLDMVSVNLEQIERALGTRIDAVIGLDFLAQQNFSLDYRHKKLSVGEGTVSSEAITFEIEHEGGGTYILIPMECGGERLRILLDTGTKDLMLFKGRLRGGLQRLRTRAEDFNLNAGGQDQLAEVEIESVRAGPLWRERQKAYVWGIPEEQFRSMDGLLGPAALGIAVVRFDFNRHTVSLEGRSKSGTSEIPSNTLVAR
jgi:predicted aspartyl protease